MICLYMGYRDWGLERIVCLALPTCCQCAYVIIHYAGPCCSVLFVGLWL